MRKMYIALGTTEYLQSVQQRFSHEPMLLLDGGDRAALLHETEEESVFEEPLRYEVLDAVGELGGTFAVLNNIPVTGEGRPIFEHRFSQRARLIEHEPGFVAIRVLRPLSNDTYIIMTFWEGRDAFEAWQRSKAYEKAHERRETDKQTGERPPIFPRPSYVQAYAVVNENRSNA